MPILSPPRRGSAPAETGVIYCTACRDRGQSFEGLKVEGERVS